LKTVIEKTVSIVGTGYVGLCTAVGFASKGYKVVAYDPKAVVNARQIFGDRIEYARSSMECLKGAECCIVVTEWEEFKQLEPKDFVRQMKIPLVIDGRRIYNQKEFSRELNFAGIGLSAARVLA
jgi:UDPglucose 6-dehydrogenase